jgi:hypothetical protein
LKAYRASLVAEFTGTDPVTVGLIERACMLKLNLAAFDRNALKKGDELSSGDWKAHAAASNNFNRTLLALASLKKPKRSRQQAHADLLAQFSSDEEAAA